MLEYLLDACALLALYKMEDGWQLVKDLLTRGALRLRMLLQRQENLPLFAEQNYAS